MDTTRSVYVFASDYSDSTRGSKSYHEYGRSLLEQFKKQVGSNEKVYLIWDDSCEESSEDKLNQIYSTYGGRGGTNPGCICQWLIDSKFKDYDIHLFLLTDGEIWVKSVNQVIECNKHLNIKKTFFYAYNLNERRIDLSVCSGFMIEAVDIYKNGVLFKSWTKAQTFNFEAMSESYEKFEELSPSLCDYIKYDFINAKPEDFEVVETIKILKNLKTKIFKLLSIENNKYEIEKELLNVPINIDREVLLNKLCSYKEDLFKSYNDTRVKTVEMIIEKCVNYLQSSHRSYNFNELKFSKILAPHNALPKELDDVDKDGVNEFEKMDIDDIIYLDTYRDVPVVTLEKIDLGIELNARTSWNKFKKTIACPIGHDRLTEILSSKNYHVYTLETFIKLKEKAGNYLTDPMTREPIAGGIVLSEAYDSYNDFVINATYFNGKKLNLLNFGLLYWTLYKTLINKSYIDKDVLEKFRKYALYRISKGICNIGILRLSAQEPEFRARTWVALFYVVEACTLMFGNDEKYYLLEKLRVYNSDSVVSEILEILNNFVKVNEEVVRKRAKIMNTCCQILSLNNAKERKYFLLKKIFKTSDKYEFLVPSLRNENEDFKCLNYLKINFKKEVLNEGVLNDEVSLDYVNSLVQFAYDYDKNLHSLELCENTFRPYFVTGNDLPWYSSVVKTAKLPFFSDGNKILHRSIDCIEFDHMVSLFKLCGEYFKLDYEPSCSRFVQFIFKRKRYNKNNNKYTIFPHDFDNEVDITYDKYEKLYKKLNVTREKFIKVFDHAAKRAERIVQENNLDKLSFCNVDGVDNIQVEAFLSECDIKYKK